MAGELCQYHEAGVCTRVGCMAIRNLENDLDVMAANTKAGKVDALVVTRGMANAMVQRCRGVGCDTPQDTFESLLAQFPSPSQEDTKT